ncbi:MAG: UvrB/UvrC motif-containing protein, partial [Alphaproteobacteria bacterium]|nr:UvrB/UvrC motif-containing protein [Alphaproteobacteria bacterium]
HLNNLQKAMDQAAASLNFEEAAKIRDEIKNLKEAELGIFTETTNKIINNSPTSTIRLRKNKKTGRPKA